MLNPAWTTVDENWWDVFHKSPYHLHHTVPSNLIGRAWSMAEGPATAESCFKTMVVTSVYTSKVVHGSRDPNPSLQHPSIVKVPRVSTTNGHPAYVSSVKHLIANGFQMVGRKWMIWEFESSQLENALLNIVKRSKIEKVLSKISKLLGVLKDKFLSIPTRFTARYATSHGPAFTKAW